MRKPRIVDAMNYIDDDLVSWAVEYRRVPLSTRLLRKPFFKACACFFAIILVFGIAVFKYSGGDDVASPFVLTAYAVSSEGSSVITAKLEKGEKVMIDFFRTEAGIAGFVFSTPNKNNNAAASITAISNGNYTTYIEEIIGIALDPTQNYFIYIPGETEVQPYTAFISSIDLETESIYEYSLLISQIDEEFYVELVDVVVREAIMK